MAPEKGLHLLAEAYRILRRERGLPPARLLAAGYLAPEHRGYLAEIETRLAGWGLRGEFEYRGALSRAEKIRFLHELDVLSVPSEYVEPKGIYLLEAMANGVPVVQPRHGAFPEILERTGRRPAVRAGRTSALWPTACWSCTRTRRARRAGPARRRRRAQPLRCYADGGARGRGLRVAAAAERELMDQRRRRSTLAVGAWASHSRRSAKKSSRTPRSSHG